MPSHQRPAMAVFCWPASASFENSRPPGWTAGQPRSSKLPPAWRSALIQVAVHQHRIEFRFSLELLVGAAEPPLDGLLALGAPPTDAPLQLLEAGGLDEHLKPFRKTTPHLTGPLQFDLQQHRSSLGQMVLHRGPRRAVEIASELSPLQEATRLNLSLEALAIEKAIGDPIDVSGSGCPGGGRHRKPEAGMALQKRRHERALAHTTGAADHGEPSWR